MRNGLASGESDGEGVAESVALALTVDGGVTVAMPLPVGESKAVPAALAVGLRACRSPSPRLSPTRSEPRGCHSLMSQSHSDGCAPAAQERHHRRRVGGGVPAALGETDAPAPSESVAVGVRDAESVAVGVRDGLALRLTVPEAIADGVSESVAVGNGKSVALG